MNTTKSNISKVRDINWANINIHRAGIIPIYRDEKYTWIGFGISNFSTNIVTIGGSYEEDDHDLLDTAIREYNEEVGNNLENITSEFVYGCYAICSDYTIQILLPVLSRPHNFLSTKELYTMIWITSKQLDVMLSHTSTILPGQGGRTKAYSFSRDFRGLGPSIIYAVDNSISYQINSSIDVLPRPKRINTKSMEDITILTDLSLFRQHIKGSLSYAYFTTSKDKLGVTIGKGSVFILSVDLLPTIIDILVSENVTLITNLERDSLQQCDNVKNVKSLISDREDLLEELYDQIHLQSTLGETGYLIKVLQLMVSYELSAYNLAVNEGSVFNRKRGCSIDAFNKVNNLLATGPKSLSDIVREIGNPEYISFRDTRYTINNISLITMWINTGVLFSPPKSAMIEVPK